MDNIINPSAARITVALPVYNAAKYLREAIDSILAQTFHDFILLIINDGSADDTEKIVLSYTDPRIRYVVNEQNIGLVRTLNKSIELTTTEYYARMDADDIAVPDRFALQLEYLDKHPDVGVCGGMMRIFGEGKDTFPTLPEHDEDIKAALLFSAQILHPSVMIRTNVLKENGITFGVPFSYDDSFGHKLLELEDYALWYKLKNVTKFHNINRVLIHYRKEGQNLSTQKIEHIRERKKKFYAWLLSDLGVQPAAINLKLHISYEMIVDSKAPDDVKSFRRYLDELLAANSIRNVYSQSALEKVIERKWDNFFYYLPARGLSWVLAYFKAGGLRRDRLAYALKFYVSGVLRRR